MRGSCTQLLLLATVRLHQSSLLVDAFATLRPVSSLPRQPRQQQHDRTTHVTVSKSSSSATTIESSNEDLLPGIAEIDKANDALFEQLQALRDQPYFRYYSVDILASCEYMPQELFECYTESCEIYPEDESEVSNSSTCRLIQL
jgi:hypothetical protein